ncbi:MAG: ATPase, T2SS/T4P/T4SS family [Planctomycetota bacterium]
MTQTATEVANGHAAPPARETGEAIAFRKSMRFFLSPILELLDDETVSEIMINGPEDVFVERKGRIEHTGLTFKDDHAVRAAANHIAQFVGKSITEEEPILDGRLPDGSRICIILPPISGRGVSVNIRKFAKKAIDPSFLIDVKAVTPEALEFILVAVEAAQNIIISGGTGSGKTTLLNIFSNAFPDSERIITIEDTRELQLQKQHVVTLEARPADAYGKGQITIRDLFVATLRMRPDRIVVGEVRRGEALDMLQAMSSGHSGSMATLHADTPMGACGRLETMCMMADSGLPIVAIRRQIADALHLIVQAVRLHSGRRLVTHITEIHFDEQRNEYQPKDLFVLDTDLEFPMLKWTGETPHLAEEVKWMGLADRIQLNRKMFGLEGS